MRSSVCKKLWIQQIARLAMQTGSCGRSQLATGTQSIGMKTFAPFHGPPRAVSAVSSLRSSAKVAGPLQAAGGGPTVSSVLLRLAVMQMLQPPPICMSRASCAYIFGLAASWVLFLLLWHRCSISSNLQQALHAHVHHVCIVVWLCRDGP
jgi:hypothetical protein